MGIHQYQPSQKTMSVYGIDGPLTAGHQIQAILTSEVDHGATLLLSNGSRPAPSVSAPQPFREPTYNCVALTGKCTEDNSTPQLQMAIFSLLAKLKCLGPGQYPCLCSFFIQIFLFPRLFLKFFTLLHQQEMSLNPSLKSNPRKFTLET